MTAIDRTRRLAYTILGIILFGSIVFAASGQGVPTDGFGATPHFNDTNRFPVRAGVEDIGADPDRETSIVDTDTKLPQSEAGLPIATAVNPESCAESPSGFGSSSTFESDLATASPFGSGSTSGTDSFASPGGFGETSEWGQAEASSAVSSAFFMHDQLMKLLALLGVSAVALFVILTRRFRWRRWVLLVSIITLGFALGGFLCPLTAVQNVVLKWNTAYLVLFAIPAVLALVLGRVFCGYVCPFGAIQEWLHLRRWSVRLPNRLDRALRWSKYGLLIYLVARIIATNTLTLAGGTPFKALFLWGGTPLTIALTGLTAVASILLYRPFCTYGCPLGALLSILSRFSLFRLERDHRCSACGLCSQSCASGTCTAGVVDSADCLLCGSCLDTCPTSCLRIRHRKRTVRRTRKPLSP